MPLEFRNEYTTLDIFSKNVGDTNLLSINKVMLCIRLCDKHTIMPKYILFWFKPFLADSCYIFLHINMLMLALVFSAFEENTKSVNKVILPRYALMHMGKKDSYLTYTHHRLYHIAKNI